MAEPQRFDRLVVLGNGYSAHLAALALSPLLPDVMVIGPDTALATGPEDLTGQYAHSHIFLPRMERELRDIDPHILEALAALGHDFVPGSYRLKADAPMACRRLFATRWQFNQAMDTVFRQRVRHTHVPDMVRDMHCTKGHIMQLSLGSGQNFSLTASTLVVDAMGNGSVLMRPLMKACPEVIDAPGGIAYITQFFRLKNPDGAGKLPDPLIECPHNFGNAYLMLYPAAEGWFSVSLAVNTTHKALMKDLRGDARFLAFCRQSPPVAAWLDMADAVGPNRIYINPRNTWRVPVFAKGHAPQNYLSVGDALTSMLPTLGANCSFAATHIRILRDLIADQVTDLHADFAQKIYHEQFAFFQDALTPRVHAGAFVPYAQSRQNRPAKRLKRHLRRFLGLDRARIERQLIGSSSL